MRRLVPVLLIISSLHSCVRREQAHVRDVLPTATPRSQYTGCFNGVGFFRTDKERLGRRVPVGFSVRDGSMMGSEHSGFALLALIYLSCPREDGTVLREVVIATPLEETAVNADLRPVRWSWYEFARLTEDSARHQSLRALGFDVRLALLSHEPFREGDVDARFAVNGAGGQLLAVHAALKDSVNFEAQSHRFWHHSADGRLLSIRLDFEDHHSWVGGFNSCDLRTELLGVAALRGLECSGIGVTEAIERLSFSEQIVVWR